MVAPTRNLPYRRDNYLSALLYRIRGSPTTFRLTVQRSRAVRYRCNAARHDGAMHACLYATASTLRYCGFVCRTLVALRSRSALRRAYRLRFFSVYSAGSLSLCAPLYHQFHLPLNNLAVKIAQNTICTPSCMPARANCCHY